MNLNIPTNRVSIRKNASKIIVQRLPILRWLPNYNLKYLSSDAIAGLTSGLIVIPQSLVYAAIAGLGPQFGLYSSYVGCFIYVLLGSCPQMAVGPTFLVSLTAFETCGESFPHCIVLSGFYAGVIQLLLVLLRLSWIVSIISEPVMVGYTAGAAFITISSQFKNLFGMKGKKGSNFLGHWRHIIKDGSSISLNDSIFGISAIVGLIIFKKMTEIDIKNKKLKTLLKYLCYSRNLLILIFTSIAAVVFRPKISLTGDIPAGLPPIELPKFILSNPENVTLIQEENFFSTLSYLSSGPFVISLISLIQKVSILKGIGKSEGTDEVQEVLALGIGNVVGSFFNSMPICVSLSRSASNYASGVKTPLNGFFCGVLVLISIEFLMPTFYYMPKSSLAAVVIMALTSLVRYRDILPMWRISKIDFFISLVTFVTTLLLGMIYGIGIGSGLNLLILIFKIARPSIELEEKDGIFYVAPEFLSYPSFDYLLEKARKLDNNKKIIFDLKRCSNVDFTIAVGIISLIKENNSIEFINVSKEAQNSFINAGISSSYFTKSLIDQSIENLTMNSQSKFNEI